MTKDEVKAQNPWVEVAEKIKSVLRQRIGIVSMRRRVNVDLFVKLIEISLTITIGGAINQNLIIKSGL
ncbi:MAG: hypothetical protein R3Y22_01265 [Bacteroidales bacterium]